MICVYLQALYSDYIVSKTGNWQRLLVWILPVTCCETMSHSGWAMGSSSNRVGAGLYLFPSKVWVPQGLQEKHLKVYCWGREDEEAEPWGRALCPPTPLQLFHHICFIYWASPNNLKKGFCCFLKEEFGPSSFETSCWFVSVWSQRRVRLVSLRKEIAILPGILQSLPWIASSVQKPLFTYMPWSQCVQSLPSGTGFLLLMIYITGPVGTFKQSCERTSSH